VEWRIGAYQGGWQMGAKIYRDWHNAAMPATPLTGPRAWAAKIRAVVKLDYVSPYDPSVLDDLATRVDPAQTLLYLADWRVDAFDTDYPNYTEASTASALAARAHQLGFHIMLHANMVGASPSNADFASVSAYQALDETGQQLLGWNWGRPTATTFAYIDPAANAYRQLLVTRLRAAIQDLGADAVHLAAAGWPANDGRGAIGGMTFSQGAAQLHQDLLAAFPGLVLSGEGTNDVIAPFQSFVQQPSAGAPFNSGTTPPIPITAYVLPNAHPYGHLAFPNPYEAGFLSYFSQYEGQTVLPTFSLGFAAADQPNYSDPDMARQMKVLGAFQQYALEPQWDAAWNGAVIEYSGNGASAALADDGTLVNFTLNAAGAAAPLYRRWHDVQQMQSDWFVLNWPAYNGAFTFGLDPGSQYWLSTQPNDASLVHLASIPPGMEVSTGTGTLVTPGFAYFKLQPIAPPAFDFYASLWQANTGITYSGADQAVGNGATAQLGPIVSGGISRTGIQAQPPYLGPSGGETFIEYNVPVPDGYVATLSFAAGIQDGAIGLRNGPMTFMVLVNGVVAWQNDVSAGAWLAGSVDLSAFLKQSVRVRFVSTPGPSGNTAYAWGGWSALQLSVTAKPSTAAFTMAVPPSLTASSLATGGANVQIQNGVASVTGFSTDSTALVFVNPPAMVFGGQSLMDLPFTASQSSAGQLAGPSQVAYAGNIGVSTSGGITKQRTVYSYAPLDGQLILSWALQLPSATPLSLSFSGGLIDGAQPYSQGVMLSLRVNGTTLWSYNANLPAQWKYASADLTPWAGQNVVLELVTDSLGQNAFDWTSWAELTMNAGSLGGSCPVTLNSSGISAPAQGLSGTVSIATAGGCSWSALAGDEWLGIASSSGTGSGTVNFTIAPNLGPQRDTTLAIAGHLLAVTQQAASPPSIAAVGIVNAASFQPLIAPGSLATIFGSGFAVSQSTSTGMPLPATIAGVSVTVNGILAPFTYLGPGQINFQVPYEVSPGAASVVISIPGANSIAQPVTVAAAAPGIFLSGSQAIAQNLDYTLNSGDHPAPVGGYLMVYTTGGGVVDNAPGTGQAASSTALSPFRATATATIGGVDAPVTFAGLVPGFAGLGQVNIGVPNMAPGTYPLVIRMGGTVSNSGAVTISASAP
jgi:uncharacterized protein (TIGR03437 family)